MDGQNLKIYIVIPAYNEGRNIAKVLDELSPLGYRIVVVDDGSSDLTGEIARSKNVILLRHIINRGQGAALETGDRYAMAQGADLAVHFDADGQFLASEIGSLIRPLARGEADAVFGSRFLEKRSNIPWLKKHILLPLGKLFNLAFLGIRMSDPQSGFRALSRKALEIIRIENDGMAHCSEILDKAHRSGLRIREVPITVVYSRFGQSMGGGLRIVADMLINKFTNK